MAERTKTTGGTARTGAGARRAQTWRGELARADRRTRALVREQPLLATAAAIAAGYVLGRLVRA